MLKENLKMVEGFVEWFEGIEDVEERREVKDKVVKGLRLRKEDGGRKEEMRRLFEEREEGWLISELGERMNISEKNVSSILSYLRKEGCRFNVMWDGRRVLMKN